MSRPATQRPLAIAAALILVGAGLADARSAGAQGLSGGSVDGTVVTGTGAPVSGATVTLTEIETGAMRRGTSGESGRWLFANVAVGSYRIDARSIGLLPGSLEKINVRLGDHVRIRLVLERESAQDLASVTITSSILQDPGSGGPSSSVSRKELVGVPLINRDFVGLFGMSAHATGAGSLWVNGQHSRFNGIQIDGTIANDIFGVNATPGSGAGGRAISIEALEEIRILVAPFDVRQGGFSGGLINAVTRSGTNVTRGALFSSYSRAELVGPDTAGSAVPAFDQVQYGLSFGGPIIRDKLHFFATGEAQSRTSAFSGPSVTEVTTGVSEATALRAAAATRDRFGFDPGGPEAPELGQPNGNLFVKLSWSPSLNNQIEITQSFLSARSDGLNRTLRNVNNVDGWQLSNSGSITRGSSFSSRIKAVSALGAFTNEAILSASGAQIRMDSRNEVPLFIIEADQPSTYLAAGSAKAAQGTKTNYRTLELTDNVSWKKGRHLLTFGTQNILLGVRDNFFLGSWGVWTFASVTAFENGQASRYEVAQPLVEGGPFVDYSAAMLSAYIQDNWRPHDRVSITAGIRADVPVLDKPRRNVDLSSNEALGRIDTGRFPSGNATLAPRFGFSWNAGRDDRTMVRGGAGVFTGRPPFVWLTGAFANTGQEQSTLICRAVDGVPAPTSDIRNLPTACLNAAAQRAVPSVTFLDEGYRFQQAIKYAAGIDHQLGRSFVASFDVIHTRSRYNTYVSDVNLAERGLNSEGRMMYGSIGNLGVSRPGRVDSLGFGPIYRFGNVSGDRSTSVSLSLQRYWRSGAVINAGYGWSRTLDVMPMTGSISQVILRNNPVDGTLSRRVLRKSTRDVPHSLFVTAIVPAWLGFTTSAFMRARSGNPYAFTVNGDANADGVVRNDLAYIPRDAADISLSNPDLYPAFDAFVESVACLRRQRGQLVTRNSCRNRAVFALDGRIAKKVWTRNSRGLEISADLFNIPNMLNSDWGLTRETSPREDAPLLPVTGWDAGKNRPRYSVPAGANGQPVLSPIDKVVPDASRWRVQVGARYDF